MISLQGRIVYVTFILIYSSSQSASYSSSFSSMVVMISLSGRDQCSCRQPSAIAPPRHLTNKLLPKKQIFFLADTDTPIIRHRHTPSAMVMYPTITIKMIRHGYPRVIFHGMTFSWWPGPLGHSFGTLVRSFLSVFFLNKCIFSGR